MNHPSRLLSALCVAALAATFERPVNAQDSKAILAKQKEEVQSNLKKVDLGKTTVVETENFIVVATLPEDKTKALGAALEKVVPLARKALQYEPKEEAWKGKLAVYFLPESRDFKGFMRSALQVKPEGVYYDVRTDNPMVVDPVEVPAKSTEADQFSNAASVVAGAYLKARGSTANIPDWLRIGFGKATALRAQGLNSTRYQNYKKSAKDVATGAKGGSPAEIADVWGENKVPNAEILAANVVEYMAYGPGAPNFLKLVYGFRPEENGNSPSVAQALEAAGWKDVPMLETAWRKWAVAGK